MAGLLAGRDRVSEQSVALLRPIRQGPRPRLLDAHVDDAGSDLPAAELREEPRREVEPSGHHVRVQPLLEAVARLTADAGVQLGAQDARAAEVGRLEHDVARVLVDLGVDGAEDTGDDERLRDVGDDQHLAVEKALDAVQRDDLLAVLARRAISLSPPILAASKACSGWPHPSMT